MARTIEERTLDYSKSIGRAVRQMQLSSGLMLTPESLKVYKPTASKSGAAVKFDLRLIPKWGKPKTKPDQDTPTIPFVENVGGGMFMELARQIEDNAKGDAQFGWKEADQRIVVKLGLPDLSAILCAIECRYAKKPLPNPKKNTKNVVSLFHKTDKGSSVIEYKLMPNHAILKVSRSKDDLISIKITMQEELQLKVYFEHALKMLMLTGMR